MEEWQRRLVVDSIAEVLPRASSNGAGRPLSRVSSGARRLVAALPIGSRSQGNDL
jgi:hypothetical protein